MADDGLSVVLAGEGGGGLGLKSSADGRTDLRREDGDDLGDVAGGLGLGDSRADCTGLEGADLSGDSAGHGGPDGVQDLLGQSSLLFGGEGG